MITIKEAPKDVVDIIGIYTFTTGHSITLRELHLDDEGRAFTRICRKVSKEEVIMERLYLTPHNFEKYLNDTARCLAIISDFTEEHL